jgi:hypothetical protein
MQCLVPTIEKNGARCQEKVATIYKLDFAMEIKDILTIIMVNLNRGH